MSLLMEALKKAEEEKKKAALEQQNGKPAEAAAGDAGAAPAGEGTHTHTIDTGSLSLEPIEERAAPPAAPAQEAEEATTRIDRAALGLAPEAEPGLLAGDRSTTGQTYDQESTVPSERAVKSSLQEYFESSQSMERSRILTGTHPSERVRVAEEPPPTAAQVVFTAKARPTGQFVGVATVGLVLVAVALGAVGFWYYIRTPATTFAPSPLVAQNVEHVVLEPIAIPPVTPPPAPPLAEAVAEPAAEVPAAASGEQPPVEAPAAAAGIDVEQPAVAAAVPPAPEAAVPPPESVAQALSESPTPSSQPEPPPAPPLAAASAPVVPTTTERAPIEASSGMVAMAETSPQFDVAPGEIRISRSKGVDEVNRQVMEGYAAYQSGDYGRAESIYGAVLARAPEQRDALLGLAAIAMLRGDRQQAAEHYGRLLRLNPKDTVAATALVALRRQDNAVADESHLKLMLEQTPQPAYLHFALGNVYARQARWAEAQQAFFDAYRQAPDSADYAFNLAVSLDHLGSREAALTYYRKSLDLSDRQPANFAPSQAMSRIDSLAGTSP